MNKKITPNEDTIFDTLQTPIGNLGILALNEGVFGILWENEKIIHTKKDSQHPIIVIAKKQLSEYFSKQRQDFNLPIILLGTSFQLKAWDVLSNIPYGQTISYSEQAKKLGDKNKARAAGMANRKNPLPIIIPCHRVIGKNGHLTGFAGGTDKKSWLLNHEKN